MKKVLSQVFCFLKHLFLRLRLVITLSVGREEKTKENTDGCTNEDSTQKED